MLRYTPGFNGATAVRPRKEDWIFRTSSGTRVLQWGRGGEAAESRHRSRSTVRRRTRFNGATAVRPRKDTCTSDSLARDGRATLQWGHGGEAVEERRHLDRRGRAVLLQWGHGGEAVERSTLWSGDSTVAGFNGATAVRPRKAGQLGLRPSWFVGFNGATAVRPWKDRGPRSRHRDASRRLQWGHGGEAVESMPTLDGCTTVTGALQWGHGGEAVERR